MAPRGSDLAGRNLRHDRVRPTPGLDALCTLSEANGPRPEVLAVLVNHQQVRVLVALELRRVKRGVL